MHDEGPYSMAFAGSFIKDAGLIAYAKAPKWVPLVSWLSNAPPSVLSGSLWFPGFLTPLPVS